MQNKISPWHVVILRPQAQAVLLAEKIEAVGAYPIILPTVEIAPIAFDHHALENAKNALAKVEMMFVASQNAIGCIPPALLAQCQKHKNLKIMTMGKATSEAVVRNGLPVFFTSPPGGTSETLLNQNFLQQEAIAGKTIALLAGEAGRTLLADVLTQRGANILWLKVYQQQCPPLHLSTLFSAWEKQSVNHCFVVTSANALNNFYTAVPEQNTLWLLSKPCIVVSERVAMYAKQLGFKQVVISHGADDEAILRVLHNSVF